MAKKAAKSSAAPTPDEEKLELAAQDGELPKVEKFLKAGVTILPGALVLAAQNGHIEVVNALLEAGAKVDKRETFPIKRTALEAAVAHGHIAIVKVLIAAGAKINNTRDMNGDTPLMVASLAGQSESVKVLLDAGADASAKTRRGETALEVATRFHDFITKQGERKKLIPEQRDRKKRLAKVIAVLKKS
jgi:ankyrin repeat protein